MSDPWYIIGGVEKLKTRKEIELSLNHVLRVTIEPHIDPLGHIRIVHGPSEVKNVLSEIEGRLPSVRRKDAVLLVENVISATRSFFFRGKMKPLTSPDPQAVDQFIDYCLRFAQREYGDNVVLVAAHLDETTVHVHLYYVPLRNGVLNASKIVGWKSDMRAWVDRLASTFAPLGLKRGIRGSKAKNVELQHFHGVINSPLPPHPGPAPRPPEPLKGLDLVSLEARDRYNKEAKLYASRSRNYVTKLREWTNKVLAMARASDLAFRQLRDVRATNAMLEERNQALEVEAQGLRQKGKRIDRAEERANNLARLNADLQRQLEALDKAYLDLEAMLHQTTTDADPNPGV